MFSAHLEGKVIHNLSIYGGIVLNHFKKRSVLAINATHFCCDCQMWNCDCVSFSVVWAVIIAFLPLSLYVFQVAQQDFVVDSRSEVSRFEEVYAVQVGDVHSPLIGWWAVGAVLLHVHAKETHFCSIYVLEGKQSFQSVREGLGHLSTVNKSEQRKQKEPELKKGGFCLSLPFCCIWPALGFGSSTKTSSQTLRSSAESTSISCLAWPQPPCLRHGPYELWPRQIQDGSAA